MTEISGPIDPFIGLLSILIVSGIIGTAWYYGVLFLNKSKRKYRIEEEES
jgi:hypothetical protein